MRRPDERVLRDLAQQESRRRPGRQLPHCPVPYFSQHHCAVNASTPAIRPPRDGDGPRNPDVIALEAGTTPQGALDTLRGEDAAAYDSFCETIAALYFMAPNVREKVGFPGRLPKPARVEVTDLEDLLLPVLEGGFVPREVE